MEAFRTGFLVIALLLVQACSGEFSNPAQYVGTWTAKDSNKNDAPRTTITLHENASFEAAAFPIALACPAAQGDTEVSGSGTWSIASGQRRIDLTFQNLSIMECSVPYLTNVFPESSFGGVVIVAYPDGVDGASTAIRLKRQK